MRNPLLNLSKRYSQKVGMPPGTLVYLGEERTDVSTFFIPLTFIAGIYGMNFKFMPELETRWGYPVVLLVMVGIGIGMFIYFKVKKWL